MCNLYTLDQTVSEVARTFDVLDEAVGSNVGSLVYPGYPGLVIAEGEVRRRRGTAGGRQDHPERGGTQSRGHDRHGFLLRPLVHPAGTPPPGALKLGILVW